MFLIQRTDSQNIHFKEMVLLLDDFLAKRDGDDHAFYDQFNKTNGIKHVVVCFENNIPVGCGAFKKYDNVTVEIKRMFVKPAFRSKGTATAVLKELENWAKENSYTAAILETVKAQPEAIALYNKNGYTLIPNFGQYQNMEKSICMRKDL